MADDTAAQKVALRAGLTSGGLTAGFTIVLWIVCLVLRTVPGKTVFVSNLADLAWSILVIGAIATIVNYIVGFVRGRIHFPGAGVNAMGRTAGGSRARWALVTGVFIALTGPVVVYVLLAFWLNSAMTIALCLLLICVPAAVVFTFVSRLTVRG